MALSKPQSGRVEEAILVTILYHDIFDFPLTKEELWKFLISEKKIARWEFEEYLKKFGKKTVYKDGYFIFSGREDIIKKRKNNFKNTDYKLNIANIAARAISIIPTILFIGVSGGLAMGDADQDDDIDFFIITKKDTIFKTRLVILLILNLLGLRRKRDEKNPADKICVNFFIDETKLAFTSGMRDLYVAHEIAQLKPLFERNATYSKFLSINMWVSDFLPNIRQSDVPQNLTAQSLLSDILNIFLPEGLCKRLQKRIIKRHKTSEIVTDHLLAFNPNDYRSQTLKKLRLRSYELGLLTRY